VNTDLLYRYKMILNTAGLNLISVKVFCKLKTVFDYQKTAYF